LPEALRITGKGGKERDVPVLPAARPPIDRYAALCPHDLPRHAAFPRHRGGPSAPAPSPA
jgi:integrase/recombinase XerC